MNMYEKIGQALSDPQFYEDNKHLENHEEIISAVQAKVPEATYDEIDNFLNKVSDTMQRNNTEDLKEEDLENVAGGIVVTAAVIGVVCKCVGVALTAGGVIGSAIWYWKNRKKK